MERFSYFMIRVAQPDAESATPAGRLAGVIERLASGEKRTFDGADELLLLVTAWPDGGTPAAPADADETHTGGSA